MHTKGALLLVLALVVTPLAGAEVISANASGFHIRVATVVPLSRGQTWELFVHPQRWWNAQHSWFGKRENFSMEPVAGGCLCETSGDKSVLHLTVATVLPGERMVLLGGLGPLQAMGLHGAASFSFEEVDAAHTRVVHDYRVSGYSASGFSELAPIVASVQQLQLDGLAASASSASRQAPE